MEIINNKVGAGRGNKATVDEDLVLSLAQMGCTYEDIARICKVDKATLVRRYKDMITEGHANMKRSLRRKQLEVALTGKGHAGMLIWLGKQNLGQREPSKEDTP